MKSDLFAALPDELTPEQSRLSGEMISFADTMEKKVFDAAAKLNGTQDIQTKNFEYETADYVVKVARGNVVEKCGLAFEGMRRAYAEQCPGFRITRQQWLERNQRAS